MSHTVNFLVTLHKIMARITMPIRAQLTVAPPWRAGACRSASSVRGRQEWSGRNHAVPASDVTSLDVPGDALARLYLMVVRGSARKAPSCTGQRRDRPGCLGAAL